MNCISCGSNNLNLFLEINNAPANVSRLLENKQQKLEKIKLRVNKCLVCKLVQLDFTNHLSLSYYEDYIMTRTSYSPFLRQYQKNLAKEFINRFGLKGKLIVEVGCGDGNFAVSFANAGAKVIGIEPSAVAAKLARKQHIKTIQKYVDDKLEMKEKFHAFSACQVFEHIQEPNKLLTNIKRLLLPESYALIEVPSLSKTISNLRFYDFFPDHSAYFSTTSLSYLLERNGFEIIDIHYSANDEYLVAFAKLVPGIHTSKDNIQKEFSVYKGTFTKFFDNLSGKRIALWGAGAKGVTLLSLLELKNSNIAFCVDSDVNKQGRFLPGGIEIVNPQTLKKEKVDIVVITAMMYRDEIIKQLKNNFGFKDSQIAVIAPTPRFLK